MIEELEYLGLTEGEIAVYEALLELGETTTGPICSKTGRQNSTVYYCLNSLVDQGLVNYVVKDNAKHYRAANPNQLLTQMDNTIKEKKEQRKELKDKLGDLQRQAAKQPAKATVYEGLGGFKTWLNRCQEEAKATTRYYTFVVEQTFSVSETIRRLLRKHNATMTEKDLTPKLLVPQDIKDIFTSYPGDTQMGDHANVRYTSDDIPSGTVIFGDSLTHLVIDDIGIKCFVLNNEKLTSSYASYFETAWESASQD